MTLAKTATTMVASQTVTAANSYTSPSGLDLSAAVDFGIGYSLTFHGSANLGARIELYADPSGNSAAFTVGSYDDPVDSCDIALDAGHTVNGFVQMNRASKYVKVKILNLGNQSITAASLYGIVQGQ